MTEHTGERGHRPQVGLKGHLFRAAADQPAWSCVHCGLFQGEVIQEVTFGWCPRWR